MIPAPFHKKSLSLLALNRVSPHQFKTQIGAHLQFFLPWFHNLTTLPMLSNLSNTQSNQSNHWLLPSRRPIVTSTITLDLIYRRKDLPRIVPFFYKYKGSCRLAGSDSVVSSSGCSGSTVIMFVNSKILVSTKCLLVLAMYELL